MDELDICKAAQSMLDQHGVRAEVEAAKRAGNLAEAGDLVGAASWARIAQTIRQLRDTAPPIKTN